MHDDVAEEVRKAARRLVGDPTIYLR